jgi:NADPH:quinone reductase-like Zn-dependent oxidoreductase
MKAVIYTQYGPPDVLQLAEIENPVPQAQQVLVKIYAASANPLDWHLMRASPFLARLENGLFRPKVTRLGADFAGRVEAVGAGVTTFRPGDAVFGNSFGRGMGAFAEYISVDADRLTHKPDALSFGQAAAVPTSALTALQGLHDKGQIRAGMRVLVNGASGGVGTFAVQIAKAFGAEVTAVCSARNLNMVRELGADHVIDYAREDFTAGDETYDLIYCAVGNRTLAEYQRALTPQGVCVIAGFTTLRLMFQYLIGGPRRSKAGGQRLGMSGTVQPNRDDLEALRGMLERGEVTPVIDRCYPLAETADAIRYLETGRALGKVVITVAQE